LSSDPFEDANDTPAADLKATFQLPIIGVKKNPQSPMYTQLGVMTKGTVIEVNVSELGLVTTGGKAVWVCLACLSIALLSHLPCRELRVNLLK
jgi:ribosomal protein S8E